MTEKEIYFVKATKKNCAVSGGDSDIATRCVHRDQLA